MSNNSNDNEQMKVEQPNPASFKFFNISRISKGSLQRYQTFYQKEDPFNDIQSALTLEQKVQNHFEKLKLDDKVVLEKFLKLKKDDNTLATAKRAQRQTKTNIPKP